MENANLNKSMGVGIIQMSHTIRSVKMLIQWEHIHIAYIIGLKNNDHDDVIIWKYLPRYWPLWGESTGGFPSQRPVTRSFDVFFDLRMNK